MNWEQLVASLNTSVAHIVAILKIQFY
jgi:hypothetical protein